MTVPDTDENMKLHGSIMKIPPELTYHIAIFLPIKALFTATLVCRRWRILLLDFPLLWTRIRIAFGGQKAYRPHLWQPLLDAYLARSQRLPISLYLSMGEAVADHSSAEVASVSALLTANMDRVRHLSVALYPPEHSTNAILTFLQVKAPILESFTLHVRSMFSHMTISTLFANDAPLLDAVELAGDVSLAGQPLLAFPSVTQLCYEGSASQVGDLLAQLPSLQRLTLVSDAEGLSWLPAVHRALDVQIHVQKEWDASRLFPRARTICYALGKPQAQNDWDVSRANLSVTLKHMGQKAVKYLDMRLDRLCVRPAPGIAFAFDAVRMTVRADDVVIAVDLDWIRQTQLVVSMLSLGAIERLVLHEGIWDDFVDLELPCLKELTIQLYTLEWWPLKRPRAARQPWKLAVLRLSRSPRVERHRRLENGELPSLKAEDIASLVRRNCAPFSLAKIALRGWELADAGLADLRTAAPHALIRFEDEIECDDWVRPAGWPARYIESDLQL